MSSSKICLSNWGDNIKKCALILGILFVCISAYVSSANAESSEAVSTDYSGQCGDDVNYEFDPDTGVLTVTGNGSMWDYGPYNPPWRNFSNFKELHVEDSVTQIGKNAFESCSELEIVILSDSVINLQDAAFMQCSSLTTVKLGNKTTSIGASVFRTCSSLQSIDIPDNVSAIYFCAFFECTSLSSVTLPDSVKTIGQSAFNKCTSLKSINLESVTSLGIYAFYTCSSLTEITLSDSLKSIGENTFYNCTSLATANIGKSVTSIGNNSFKGGTALESLTLPDAVTSIGTDSFSGCTSLLSVYIPDSLESIGENAFHGCTSLNSFEVGAGNKKYSSDSGVLFNNDKTELIQYPACNTVDTYEIPASVSTIRSYAFENCSTLKSLTIPGNIRTLGLAVFNGCSNLHSLSVPADMDCVGTNTIPYFDGCVNIENITFTGTGSWFSYSTDSSVKPYYGNTPWQLSRSVLSTVNIAFGVQDIGTNAFYGCDKLASLSIPESVGSIQSNAFAGCTGLSALKIPDSVTSLGEYAFAGCIGLIELTVSACLDCVGSNEKPAFYDCRNVGSITFTGSGDWYSYGSSSSEPSYYSYTPWQLAKAEFSVTVSKGVLSVGNYAFMTCSTLRSVSIADSVKTIGSSAFQGCSSVSEIILPDSVTSIGSSAFKNCRSLTTMDLKSVSDLGDSAFEGGTGLTSVTLSAVKTLGQSAFKNCTELSSADLGSVTSVGNMAFQGCAKLVSANVGRSVTAIGESAFSGCTLIDFYILPESVTSIGSSAFKDCRSISTIVIHDSVQTIGSSAFQGCTSLEAVTLSNNLSSIETDTFYGCSSLKSVAFPDALTSIGDHAFYGCRDLLDVYLPDSLGSIGASAFYGCSSLDYVNFPDSVSAIGNYCFYGCTNLGSLDLGAVTSVGDYAFSGCTKLSSVDFGSLAATIGSYAFYGCTALKSATLGSVMSLGDASFKDCTGLNDLSVPATIDCVGSADKPVFSGCTNIKKIAFTGSGAWYQYGDSYAYAPWQLSKYVLSSVSVSDGVTSVGDYAFEDCSNLQNVTLGKSLASLGKSVFKGCTALISIQVSGNSRYSSSEGILFDTENASLVKYPAGKTDLTYQIPAGVESVEDYAFEGCTNLTCVSIPGSVLTLGYSAFKGCVNLAELTIPACIDSVRSDDYPTFEGCTNIQKITFTGNGDWCQYGLSYEYTPWQLSRSVLTEVCILDGVTSIGAYAFSGCAGLSKFTIGEAVSTIEAYALMDCCSIETIIIPNAVASVGISAFKGCTGLHELCLPVNLDSVVSTENPVFEGCTNIETITIGGSGAWFDYGLSYEYTPWEISRSGLSVVKISDYVKTIGDYAFTGCSKLSYVYIGTSVNSIGTAVFSGCTSLTYIEVSGSNADFRSVDNVLFDYDKTVLIQFPIGRSTTSYEIPSGVSKIGEYAFSGCSSVNAILIPESVTYLGQGAFNDCEGLYQLSVPATLDCVGSDKNPIFAGCTSIKTIIFLGSGKMYDYGSDYEYTPWQLSRSNLVEAVISGKVFSVSDNAFSGCSNLSAVTIGNSVSSIGTYAFKDCSALEELTIPAGIDSVGSAENPAFDGCTNIKKITVTGSGDWYPYGTSYVLTPWQISRSNLTEVTVSAGVTSIGDNAFSGCAKLATVSFGTSVTKIGNSAFAGCSSLGSLELSNAVTSIGISAFKDCTDLKELILPAGLDCVVSTENPVFEGCTEIETVTFTGSGDWYSYGTSYLHTPWQYSRSNLTKITVSVGVTSVGDNAFSGCSNLATVSFGTSVTKIGNSAFAGCTSIVSIEFPESLSEIGNSAFAGCSSLGSLELSNAVTSIGTSAFKDCTCLKKLSLPAGLDSVVSPEDPVFEGCVNIETVTFTGSGDWFPYNDSYPYTPWQLSRSSLTGISISDSIRSIGDNAFAGCTELSSVYIGTSVVSIGTAVFRDCKSLATIVVSGSNADFRSVENVLYNGYITKLILYPLGRSGTAFVVPDGVRTISEYAFYGCTSLLSVSIPDSVSSIGTSAFSGCTGLKELIVPATIDCVGDAEHPIFEGCSGLTKITFGGTGKWYDYAPSDYGLTPWQLSRSSVTTIVISEGISSICESAFRNYTGLKDLTVPASLDCVGSNTGPIFEGCTDIETITFTGDGNWYEYGTSGSQPSYYGFTPWQLSRSCLTKVCIADGVGSIGAYAFMNCTAVKSLDIPDSVTSIGDGAFYGCGKLSSVSIGSSVSEIGNSVFRGCSSLTTVTVIGNDHFYSKDNVLFDSETTILFLYPAGKDDSDYTVPGTVSSIVAYAFSDNLSLRALLIPGSVTSFGKGAFYNCNNLTELTVPAGLDCVCDKDNPVFYGCSNITKITFIGSGEWHDYGPSDYKLTPWQFSRSGLTEIFVSEGITSVGDNAFSGCAKLSKLTIGNSVSKIGNSAFAGCTALGSLVLPNTVTSIGISAFKDCAGLKELALPACLDSVVSIENPVFEGCTGIETVTFTGSGDWCSYGTSYVHTPWQLSRSNLTEVTVSEGVTSVDDNAFNGCAKLSKLTIGNSVSKIGNSAFAGCSSLGSLELSAAVTSIGTSAFKDCAGLKELTLPAGLDSVVSSEHPAFEGCSNIETITFTGSGDWFPYNDSYPYTPWQISRSNLASITVSDGVRTIGDRAFSGCTGLSSIRIGNSVNSIGSEAFRDCTALASIVVSENNAYLRSEGDVLFDSGKTVLIQYPLGKSDSGYGIPDGVKSVREYAFSGCTALAEISLPDSVASVGIGAFSGCTGLNVLTVPAGLDCVVSNTVPVFEGCVGIGKITFTGSGAWFQYGTDSSQPSYYGYAPWQLSRSSLSSVTVTYGITSIGGSAFKDCTNISELAIPACIDSVGSTDHPVFEGCVSIEKITFVGSGDWYAYGSSYVSTPWQLSRLNLNSVVISDGVTSVGDFAFENCTKLASVCIGKSVSSIGTSVFRGCSSLTSISVSAENTRFCSADDVLFDKGLTTIVQYPIGRSDPSYTFPGTVGCIGEGAFYGCVYLKILVIPGSVTSIGASAFYGCTGLNELTVPAGLDCVGSVDDPIFEGCTNIVRITFTGSGDWHACDSFNFEFAPWQLSRSTLNSITISEGVTSVADSAFSGCSNVRELSIPANLDCVGSIDKPVFEGCTNIVRITFTGSGPWHSYDSSAEYTPWQLSRSVLSAVVIADGVVSLGDLAFKGCTELSSISVGRSVSSIATSAFEGCASLVSIDISDDNPYYRSADGVLFDKNTTTLLLCLEGKKDSSYAIPDTVVAIADDAFKGCTSLITVTIPGSVTFIGTSAFDGKFYDSDGVTELDQTAADLAGFTFMKTGEKWVKQVSANTDNGSAVNYALVLIVAIIAVLAVVAVAKKKFA